jgi:hypothetical protein
MRLTTWITVSQRAHDAGVQHEVGVMSSRK